jgi:hypothetical protein
MRFKYPEAGYFTITISYTILAFRHQSMDRSVTLRY